jgi:hypothetical protein
MQIAEVQEFHGFYLSEGSVVPGCELNEACRAGPRNCLRGMVTDWKETVNWAIAPYNTINSLTRQFHFFVTINPKGANRFSAVQLLMKSDIYNLSLRSIKIGGKNAKKENGNGIFRDLLGLDDNNLLLYAVERCGIPRTTD